MGADPLTTRTSRFQSCVGICLCQPDNPQARPVSLLRVLPAIHDSFNHSYCVAPDSACHLNNLCGCPGQELLMVFRAMLLNGCMSSTAVITRMAGYTLVPMQNFNGGGGIPQ